jgi:hypothetical protein
LFFILHFFFVSHQQHSYTSIEKHLLHVTYIVIILNFQMLFLKRIVQLFFVILIFCFLGVIVVSWHGVLNNRITQSRCWLFFYFSLDSVFLGKNILHSKVHSTVFALFSHHILISLIDYAVLCHHLLCVCVLVNLDSHDLM